MAERSEAEVLAFLLQILTEIEAKIIALQFNRNLSRKKVRQNDEVVLKKVRHSSKKFVKKGQMTKKNTL